MERRKPLRADPDKQRAWQQRGAQRYAERRRDQVVAVPLREEKVDRDAEPQPLGPKTWEPRLVPQKRSRKGKPGPSDGPWREAVLARYGSFCVVWGCMSRDLQADHIWPKSQGRKDPRVRDVRNGAPLCRTHHEQKTNGTLQYRWSWLLPDTREFLAEVGWVTWDDDGQPRGWGYKHFAPKDGGSREKGGDPDGG